MENEEKKDEGKKADVFEEDDDFNFGDNKGADDKGEDGKGGDDKGGDDKGKDDKGKDTGKGNDDNKGDDKGADDKKGDEGKKEGEKEKVDKKDDKKEDDDFFSDTDDKQEDGKTEKKINYKKLASGLQIELEKEDDENEFLEKARKKLEDNKQEFKLDEYPEDAKKIIRHIKDNGGSVEDFFNNDVIINMRSIINLKPEKKLTTVRVQELVGRGMDEKKAVEQADAEISELSKKQLQDLADDIDANAKKLVSDEITKITGDREKQKKIEQEKVLERRNKERDNIIEYVNKQTEFLGLEITAKAKKSMVDDIMSGKFDDIANQNMASSKFVAYMHGKFGTKINGALKAKLTEASRTAFNEADKKNKDALHNPSNKNDKKQSASGHSEDKGNKEKFGGFRNSIDDDSE